MNVLAWVLSWVTCAGREQQFLHRRTIAELTALRARLDGLRKP